MDYKIFSAKNIAKALNNRMYTDYYYRLMLKARSRFEWKNLPNGIDEKWIEKYLFSYGSCIFYKDETLGFMVAKYGEASTPNYYDEPTKVRPIATNYAKSKIYENGVDCVVIRNNDDMIPTAPTIELYALELAEIQRTIDVNIKAMKTPILIHGTNKQMLSLKNIYNQLDENRPAIFTDKDFDLGAINVLKTDAPIVFDKLQIQKHAVWNECMSYLGINNANMDKRERLVTNEVEANNEQIGLALNVALKARKEACKLINEMFNLNVSVDLREDLKATMEELESEVDEDGSKHNNLS